MLRSGSLQSWREKRLLVQHRTWRYELFQSLWNDFSTFSGAITDFEILGSSSFFVGVIEHRRIVILSLDKQEIYLNEPAPHEIDFVVCHTTSSVCQLIFGSRSDNWHTITLPGDVAASKETNRFENWHRDQIQEFFHQVTLITFI